MSLCAIINPQAGGWRKRPVKEAADPAATVRRWLEADSRIAPRSITMRVLNRPEESAMWARQAIEAGVETIVAVGGDGTINDVLQGMMDAENGQKARAVLGIIPMGTANVLARIVNIPLEAPESAARIITAGQTRGIDLARSGTRWFTLMAGIGLDGEAARAVSLPLKRRMGEWAYVWAAWQQALRYPPQHVQVTADDGEAAAYDAYLVVVANGTMYGGRFPLGPSVQIDDGWLDVFVCLRKGAWPLCALKHGAALLMRRFEDAPGVVHRRVQSVSIEASNSLRVQLDGEPVGVTPTHIFIAPNALEICVPK